MFLREAGGSVYLCQINHKISAHSKGDFIESCYLIMLRLHLKHAADNGEISEYTCCCRVNPPPKKCIRIAWDLNKDSSKVALPWKVLSHEVWIKFQTLGQLSWSLLLLFLM